jgi:hypothetical protein
MDGRAVGRPPCAVVVALVTRWDLLIGAIAVLGLYLAYEY